MHSSAKVVLGAARRSHCERNRRTETSGARQAQAARPARRTRHVPGAQQPRESSHLGHTGLCDAARGRGPANPTWAGPAGSMGSFQQGAPEGHREDGGDSPAPSSRCLCAPSCFGLPRREHRPLAATAGSRWRAPRTGSRGFTPRTLETKAPGGQHPSRKVRRALPFAESESLRPPPCGAPVLEAGRPLRVPPHDPSGLASPPSTA